MFSRLTNLIKKMFKSNPLEGDKCHICKGLGHISENKGLIGMRRCAVCNGRGYLNKTRFIYDNYMETYIRV